MAAVTTYAAQAQNRAALNTAAGRLSRVIRAGAVGGVKGMHRVGIAITNDWKRSIRHHGTGQVYVRAGRSHQASAPGEPPSSDSGRMLGAIFHDVAAVTNGAELTVGANVEYGPFNEFGTVNMDPRPALRPAVRGVTRKMAQILGVSITEEERRNSH